MMKIEIGLYFVENLVEVGPLRKFLFNWSLNELESGNYGSETEKSLKRMLALVSWKGGIPIYSLDKIPGLKRPQNKFESIGLPALERWEEEKDFVEKNSGVLYAMTNYKRIRSGEMSKEELKVCFWDYIIGPCLLEGEKNNKKIAVESNYNLKSLFSLDVRADWVIILKSFNVPILFIEILNEFSTKENYEKGLTKVYAEMTESCKKLTREFVLRGLDPKGIRIFGVIIWRSEIQLCLAYPSITLKRGTNEIEEIVVNLSGYGNQNWFMDTLQYKQGFFIGTDYDKFMKDARKLLQDRIINKESLCKLKSYFTTAFTFIDNLTEMLEFGFSPRMIFTKESKPTNNIKINPDVYYSIPDAFKLFFPLLRTFNGKTETEKLEPIAKNVCETSLRKHFLEACTFAIHVLFELLILHEKAGYIHSNINCENIKFSPLLQIWKLCNFDDACKIEESKTKVRIIGTIGFISPESNSTGLFTEASDVFALGKVLSKIFYLEMAYEIELRYDVVDKSDVKAVEDLFAIICKMCKKDVAERITVRAALTAFYVLAKKNKIDDFFLYGTNLMFPFVESLLKRL